MCYGDTQSVKTRKPHTCYYCSKPIAVGSYCITWTGVEEGQGWWTAHGHSECYDLNAGKDIEDY